MTEGTDSLFYSHQALTPEATGGLKHSKISDRQVVMCLAAGFALLIYALTVSLINHTYFQYPGVSYFPKGAPLVPLLLLITYWGFRLQFSATAKTTEATHELLLFFIVMSVIAIATNATQYTPFSPIDKHIIQWESSVNLHLTDLLTWTYSSTKLPSLLVAAYNSLNYQLVVLPLLIIVAHKREVLREFYFLLLVSTLIGFVFYYFFPTIAPASNLESPYFLPEQRNTGVKFEQIHHHIQPKAVEGGMIALPSFHMIWAWFCLYLIRPWRLLFLLLLPWNLLLIASCVLLGWHYLLDLVAGAVVILCSHVLYFVLKTR